MTRSELTAALALRFPQLVQKDAEMAVAEILGAIASALARLGVKSLSSYEIDRQGSDALQDGPCHMN